MAALDGATGRAALWMTGAIASFSSMAVAGRALASELDTFEMMMYRSFIGVVIVFAIGAATGHLHEARTNRFGLHLLRNLFHFTGQNLWFAGLSMIPLAQLFALEFTSPIWTMVLAALFLGEAFTRARLTALALGFVGILIVARPGSAPLEQGVIVALAAAFGFASTFVVTKLLTRTETITCILVWLTVMQAVFGVVMAGFDGDIAWPSAAAWPWVVTIGCAGLFAHYCVTSALALAPATVVVPMDFARLPVIAVVGMLLFDEALDPLVFAGAAAIFLGNWLNLRAEARKARPVPVTSP